MEMDFPFLKARIVVKWDSTICHLLDPTLQKQTERYRVNERKKTSCKQ